jgi:hypothetical protein
MGWIISTIVLSITLTAMGFALRNLLIKNEKLEDFISKQSDAINQCDLRLKQIDDKNIFYADDEIGWFFKEIKKFKKL